MALGFFWGEISAKKKSLKIQVELCEILKKFFEVRKSHMSKVSWIGSKGTNLVKDKVFCFCRTNDDGSFMICCDKCDEWFHGRCVKIKRTECAYIDKYVCPTCRDKGLGRTTYKMTPNSNTKNAPNVTTTNSTDGTTVDSKRLSVQERLKNLREERALRQHKKREGNMIEKKNTIVPKNNNLKKTNQKRLNCITKFTESLSIDPTEGIEIKYTPEQAAKLIEQMLMKTYKSIKSTEYLQKFRTLVFNLGDKKKH